MRGLANLMLILCSVLSWTAYAQEIGSRQFTERDVLESRIHGRQRQLTDIEWQRYETLMLGTRGIWTPSADPLLVLGAHAASDQERRRYADLYVAQQFERVEGELAFQRAVTAAWARNFPQQARIGSTPFVSRGQDTVKSLIENAQPRRYGVVVEIECASCRPVVNAFVSRAKKPGHPPVDFFVRGTDGVDTALLAWATQHNIPVETTLDKRVTLNHGSDYSGPVPQTYVLRRDGQWQSVE
jgi:integrating conjugative element protein (TIGR03759 family)